MVAASTPGSTPGEILAGKYRVEAVIGIGGMGRVIKANHLYLHQPVAIKILLPQMVESASTVARFLREAQSTVKLRSEHIARVIDVGTMSDNTPFIVMEFLEGFDLNQILRHHGPQMAQPVVDLILQACEGLAEAHSVGIIHRDIKPSNFFITRRPDGSNLLKILDFGISKTPAELSELTGTQTVVGTPTYMAPEQMRTARSTDPRSDIWSMGVVMYQMLAGRPPFEAESYAELVLKVGTEPPTPLQIPLPAGLDSIVMRCLEKDPKNRIQTVGELARMIAPYASDPMSAQQSAERATRILTANRNSNMSLSSVSVGGNGMGLTPSPATNKSWNNGSSVGGAAGQMGTKVTRGGRGLVIAGVATLIVAAGAGGFVIANNMGKSEITHVGTPNPLEATMTADQPNPPPKADPPKPDPVDTGAAVGTAIKVDPAKTADAVKTDAVKTDAVKTDAAKTDAVKTDAAKTDATKTDATKTDAVVKTDAVKTDATKAAAVKTDAAKTDAGKTDATKTAVKTDATKTAAVKTDATKTDATKSAKADATKTVAKSTPKTDATKTTKSTTAKSTTKSTKPKDDLFDDRH